MERDILHCDLNNFFASVECAEQPQLLEKSKYIAVSGNPDARHGIILAKNTAAKQMGVKTAEAIWQARKKCPELLCVPPHMELYVNYSKKVRDIYCKYTDLVESFGLDECWLDVTHSKIFGSPFEIAEKIRNEVREKLGITISVGVSFNKPFAKLGSDLKKPDATTVISRENYKDVVWKLPAGEMISVGWKTSEKLANLGIFTIGDLANADLQLLTRVFGINGNRMQLYAQGNDCEPVQNIDVERQIKSVGHGTTTRRDMTTFEDTDCVISALSDMVATRMRRYGIVGNVIHLSLRLNDLSHEGKQTTIHDTFVSGEIATAAYALLRKLWNANTDKPIRSLTVSVAGIKPVGHSNQLSIFDLADEKKQRLELSIDQIRKKFGFSAIRKASFLGNDLIADKFCDEDDLLPFKHKR